MTKAKTKKTLLKDFKKNLPLLLLTIPGAVYIIINNYLPMFGVFIPLNAWTMPRACSPALGWGLRILSSCSPPLRLPG